MTGRTSPRTLCLDNERAQLPPRLVTHCKLLSGLLPFRPLPISRGAPPPDFVTFAEGARQRNQLPVVMKNPTHAGEHPLVVTRYQVGSPPSPLSAQSTYTRLRPGHASHYGEHTCPASGNTKHGHPCHPSEPDSQGKVLEWFHSLWVHPAEALVGIGDRAARNGTKIPMFPPPSRLGW